MTSPTSASRGTRCRHSGRGYGHCATGSGWPTTYYVSLAEALQVPLLTTDLRLARAVRDREVVEVMDVDER